MSINRRQLFATAEKVWSLSSMQRESSSSQNRKAGHTLTHRTAAIPLLLAYGDEGNQSIAQCSFACSECCFDCNHNHGFVICPMTGYDMGPIQKFATWPYPPYTNHNHYLLNMNFSIALFFILLIL